MNTILDVLERGVARAPGKTAVIVTHDGEQPHASLSYEDLWAAVRGSAAALTARCERGSRAVLLLPTGLDFVVSFLGSLAAGVIPIPVAAPRSSWAVRGFCRILEQTSPAFVLADSALWRRASKHFGGECGSTEILFEVPRGDGAGFSPRPVDTAFLQYTSGSTSDPKGVVVTHRNLCANQRMIEQTFRQCRDSVVVSWLPLYHDMGLVGGLLHGLYLGATVVLMPPPRFVENPLRWLRAITKFRGTISGGPDSAYQHCLDALGESEATDLALENWQVAFTGSEKVRLLTINAFSQRFETSGFRREAFCPCYGMAEATLMISGVSPGGRAVDVLKGDSVSGRESLVGCGPVLPGETWIVDESGHRAADGECGEIVSRSDSITPGYWGQLPPEPGSDPACRLLKTGDLGVVRNGELFVVGRMKELIILNGRNIYPQDIEELAVSLSPDFVGCKAAAFGVDIEGGEKLVVVSELIRGDSRDLELLRARVWNELESSLEVPVMEVRFIRKGTLPRTTSGKVQRLRCRQMFLDGEFKDISPFHRKSELTDGLSHVLDEISRFPETGKKPDESPFPFVGMDSLKLASLAAEIERKFGVEVSLSELWQTGGIAALGELIAEKNLVGKATPVVNEVRESAPVQEAIWADALRHGHGERFNIPARVALPEEIAVLEPVAAMEKIRAALSDLMKTVEILRTGFRIEEGRIVPFLVSESRCRCEFVADRDSKWKTVLNEPFGLGEVPLWRALVRSREGSTDAWLVFHQSIADGYAIGLVLQKLAKRLRGEEEMETCVPFHRIVPRLSACSVRDLHFWREEISSLGPHQNLMPDFVGSQRRFARKGHVTVALSTGDSVHLNACARHWKSSVPAVVCAAFVLLLSKVTRQSHVSLGITSAGRDTASSLKYLGPMVLPLFAVLEIDERMTLSELVGRAAEKLKLIFTHQRGLHKALETVPGDMRERLARQVFFNSLDFLKGGVEQDFHETFDCQTDRTANYELNLYHATLGGRCHLRLEYDTSLYREKTMDFWLKALTQMIVEGCREPGRPLGEFRLDAYLAEV